MERISSRQNALVKRFRQVAAGDPAGEWMLLDGEHLVVEALASGLEVDVLAVTDAADEAGGSRPSPLTLERRGARVVIVSAPVLGAISPDQATVRRDGDRTASVDRCLEQVLRAHPALVVIVNEIQDPGNVGAIVRAAEGCGATGIVVDDRHR